MRRQGGTGQAVEQGDIVPVGRPAEMLQCERRQPIEIERGRDLVISKAKIFIGHRQRMFEPGEHEHVFRPTAADDGPGPLQFAKIILGGGKDPAARIGEVRRVPIAEAIGRHQLRLPG